MFNQLGLIGCGLMGGSFAMALKRAGMVRHVVGYSKSPSTTERARHLGVIDSEASSALQAVAGSDIVLLAVPVAATEATLKAIRHLVTREVLVMDVGSTKRDVVDAARHALKDMVGSFVPCHPMTGKESSGIEHADPDLYKGRQVIITPIERTLVAHLKRAQQAWEAVGGVVLKMSPDAHDAAVAAVSHLPHLLAFAYMNGIGAQSQGEDFLALAGPGFRDFSRIAASDPYMWRDILLANKAEVLSQSRQFRESLAALEKIIEAGDGPALEARLGEARALREPWRLGGA